jgi:hypothetical protein
MIFDDSAGESQSIKLRADGKVPMATSGSSDIRGRPGRLTAPIKGVGTDPTGAPGTLAEVVYEDQWGQPYRDH